MKNPNSKALEFIYQDVKIHFLFSNDENVMVNATEMAKAFNRRIDFFLKTEPTKAFINALEFPPTGVNSQPIPYDKIIQTKGKMGTYFNQILAMKFAAWLDPNFEVWIFRTILNILLGNYKQHWDAHIKQENAKAKMETAKRKLLLDANQEDAISYFEAENEYKSAKNDKLKAIQSQYKLFDVL